MTSSLRLYPVVAAFMGATGPIVHEAAAETRPIASRMVGTSAGATIVLQRPPADGAIAGTAPASNRLGFGIGRPPQNRAPAQARFLAKRAAEVRAVADLACRAGCGVGTQVKGFRYVSTRYRPDGWVEVKVRSDR